MITLGMIENGARVYAIGRTKEALDEIVRRYSGSGSSASEGGKDGGKDGRGMIVPIVGDVTDKESLRGVVKQIEEHAEGGLQVL
jgi:NAD(P)-dependent dehydrogenase (short-subunit alcohol dehydrogenase family)